MSRKFGIRLASIALLSVGVSLSCVAQERGFADPILGRWDLTVQGKENVYPSWIDIHLRTEQSLMADFVGRFGSKRHASVVRFSDGLLEVRVPAQYEDGDELVFHGTLEDGRLSGETQIDGAESASWVGLRAPGLVRRNAGAWGAPISLVGADLSNWAPRFKLHAGCWKLDEGILSATPPCVDLVSRERFDDFRLSLDFRYPPGSNSGVYLRGRYEVQIQDDVGMATDWLRIGSIYGFIAPAVNAARSAGEWQSLEVELIGRRVTVTLNGLEIVTGQEVPGITGGALDSGEGEPGPLMLQGDHGPIEFRNIVVTPAR